MIDATIRLCGFLKDIWGVFCCQCRWTPDEPMRFFEINPRFGGGAPLSIKAGANFPLWILRLWLGQKPRIRQTGWRDGLTMLRYDEAVWKCEE